MQNPRGRGRRGGTDVVFRTSSRGRRAGLELQNARLLKALDEAELKLVMQSSASRILALALTGPGERDSDDT